MTERQELLDRFYFTRGKCCAGCDWWRHHNAVIGDCTRTEPVGASERISHIRIQGYSGPPTAGHIMTMREHVCGEFADTFDWSSLPIAYLKRIGAPPAAPTNEGDR